MVSGVRSLSFQVASFGSGEKPQVCRVIPGSPPPHPHLLSRLVFGVWGVGCGVWGLRSGVWDLGSEVWGLGSGVWGLGFGAWDSGFGSRVQK